MKAEIVKINGNTCVRINGEVFPFAAQRSFRPDGEIIRDFAKHKIRLFNIFPSGIMTALVNRTVPYSEFGPVWAGDHEYNWDNLRAQCKVIFGNIGEGDYVGVCAHLDPPDWYVASHSGLVDHWEQFHNNVSDKQWQKDAADYMCALVDKLDEWYPDKVFAIYLFCGGTTEWYSYHWDKTVEHPTEIQQKAYAAFVGTPGAKIPSPDVIHGASDGVFRHPVDDKDAIGYWSFIEDETFKAQEYFAKVAKEHTHGTKLVGLFNAHIYGQQLDASVRTSYNHIEKLLDCPYIDIIMAPASYTLRKLDSTSSIRVPADFISLKNKLYVHEIDSATNKSEKSARSALDAAAVHQHSVGRDEVFTSSDETIAYMRRETGTVIAKGQGYWWFDMFGGNYEDPAVMAEIERQNGLCEKLLSRDCSQLYEVSVMLDKRSNLYLKTKSFYPIRGDVFCGDLNGLSTPWEQSDTFALCDENYDSAAIRLFIFPNLVSPDEKIRERIAALRKAGKCMLFVHAPGYVSDDGFSVSSMEELTGIEFEREELSDNTVCGTGKFDGISYRMDNHTVSGDIWRIEGSEQTSPVFSAKNLDVVFGTFAENGHPAAGIKYRKDGGFDAFFATAPAPKEFIKEVYRLAGIFRYAETDEVIYLNKGFECVYSYKGGDIKLYRKEPTVLVDFDTGKEITVSKEGTTVHLLPVQTKLYYAK